MNCLFVVAVDLIYTQNFPVRPETFGTNLVLNPRHVHFVVQVLIIYCDLACWQSAEAMMDDWNRWAYDVSK